MKYLSADEEKEIAPYINKARITALNATCTRLRGGSVIVSNGEVIGIGFNSPVANDESMRRCSCDKNSYHRKVTDKTCCIHAEQRAIFDALKNNPDKIIDSTIYFVKLSEKDEIAYCGQPYCTLCSKSAQDVGIKKFVLQHKEGFVIYDIDEYTRLSYEFNEL